MPAEKEWTLMFYFASDNPLAPSTVSQLKAIKQAGFHQDANVITHFDPHTKGTPTHIFDVNLTNKLQAPGKDNIGFQGNDPYVRSLVCDRLWDDEDARVKDAIRKFINRDQPANEQITYEPPSPPSTTSTGKDPQIDLSSFLEFCRDKYPARHYVLFILGHGLIVGNDLFLFDEDAKVQSLGLKALRSTLQDFKAKLTTSQKFELISFHSCSMSSLEVAYELRGIADYMLASQGPTFVGSWPYRQILIRIFNDLKKFKQNVNVKTMLTKIFSYCVTNSYDFQLAGYPFDLCLTDLNKLDGIHNSMAALSTVLVRGLQASESDPTVTNMILLAHWESQSFWQENYTDLYDFCFRLDYGCSHVDPKSNTNQETLKEIHDACGAVMDALKRGTHEDDDRLIVRSDFVGPAFQYTHGFSIYFPWTRPMNEVFWTDYSQKYDFESTKWHEFLKTYWDTTKRLPHVDEKDVRDDTPKPYRFERELMEEITTLVFSGPGQLGTVKNGSLDATGGGKHGSNDTTGGSKNGSNDWNGAEGEFPSIKNFPSTTRSRNWKPS